MKKTEVLRYFGTQVKLANALGISQASISNWGDIIPEKQALRLEKVTQGALKYDVSFYERKKSTKRNIN
ncbi:hypothetical protein CBF23_007810 [Marinomonas agarivorans]|nr:hypothetical protein CBF23_007810 [Marinomonas agarivorans]